MLTYKNMQIFEIANINFLYRVLDSAAPSSGQFIFNLRVARQLHLPRRPEPDFGRPLHRSVNLLQPGRKVEKRPVYAVRDRFAQFYLFVCFFYC